MAMSFRYKNKGVTEFEETRAIRTRLNDALSRLLAVRVERDSSKTTLKALESAYAEGNGSLSDIAKEKAMLEAAEDAHRKVSLEVTELRKQFEEKLAETVIDLVNSALLEIAFGVQEEIAEFVGAHRYYMAYPLDSEKEIARRFHNRFKSLQVSGTSPEAVFQMLQFGKVTKKEEIDVEIKSTEQSA